MSMTPKEAAKYICPVRGRREEDDGCLNLPRMCVGPECMWWVESKYHEEHGDCAINLFVYWAETINSTVRDS